LGTPYLELVGSFSSKIRINRRNKEQQDVAEDDLAAGQTVKSGSARKAAACPEKKRMEAGGDRSGEQPAGIARSYKKKKTG